MAAYARQAKDSELIQYATEIKVRAERRCGELLRTNVATASERGSMGATARWSGKSNEATSHPQTLSEMGLTKDESSRYQQLAAMPDDHFETAVATAKATAGEVTTAFMLREAGKSKPQRMSAKTYPLPVMKPATVPVFGAALRAQRAEMREDCRRHDQARTDRFRADFGSDHLAQ